MSGHDGDDVDLSMYLYKILQERLVSRQTALEFAKLLIADRFGNEEVDRQAPLAIHDVDDTRVIEGSARPNWNDGRDPGVMRNGKIEIAISQFDGRIIKLTREAPLVPPGQGKPPATRS